MVRGGVVKRSARESLEKRLDGSGPIASLGSIMTELALFLLFPLLVISPQSSCFSCVCAAVFASHIPAATPHLFSHFHSHQHTAFHCNSCANIVTFRASPEPSESPPNFRYAHHMYVQLTLYTTTQIAWSNQYTPYGNVRWHN